MNWLKEILSAKSGQLSSKRVCGGLGWLIILGSFMYCTYSNTEAPTMVNTLIIASTGLLGVDSVTEIFKEKQETGSNE